LQYQDLQTDVQEELFGSFPIAMYITSRDAII